MSKGNVLRTFGLVLVTFAVACPLMGWSESPVMASSRISAERLQQYSDLAVTWMQEYLRVDTTNPPGKEMQAVEFYKKILDAGRD